MLRRRGARPPPGDRVTESWSARRGRSTSVLAILAGGAGSLIGSTQVWATASLADADVTATGADGIALLQPLSLAALALSLALALSGPALRYVLAALGVVIGAALVAVTAPVAWSAPTSVVQTAVTDHTGISGEAAVAGLVSGIAVTPWAWLGAVFGALVALGGLLALVTARSWRRGGRRFDTGAGARPATGPLDAVDTWDDLSRGDDPTRPA
nr:Trp biosynthesis-associated membrane protein [Microbacterium excoecariae]